MIKLLNKSYVIISYVVLLSIQLCYSILSSMESSQIVLVRFLTVTIVVALAFGVWKKNRFCRVLIAILISLTGVSGIVVSLLAGVDQWAFKVAIFVMSIYFVIGGFMMFRRD